MNMIYLEKINCADLYLTRIQLGSFIISCLHLLVLIIFFFLKFFREVAFPGSEIQHAKTRVCQYAWITSTQSVEHSHNNRKTYCTVGNAVCLRGEEKQQHALYILQPHRGFKMCKGKIEDDADCDLQHQRRRNGAREKRLCGRSQHSDARNLMQVQQRSVGECSGSRTTLSGENKDG